MTYLTRCHCERSFDLSTTLKAGFAQDKSLRSNLMCDPAGIASSQSFGFAQDRSSQ